MAKQRMVNTKFWSDSFVVDELNPLDRYLFLYLLTNEKTNIIGIYELSLRTASFETGIEKDNLQKMLERLSPKVEYADGWVYIRNFTAHQQSNPSVDKGVMREFFNLPQNVIDWVQSLGVEAPKLVTAYDTLYTASPQSVTESGRVPVTKPNLTLTKPNLTKPNLTYSEQDSPDEIAGLYYEVIKVYGLPVKNHNNVRAAIGKLKSEIGIEAGRVYLRFLIDQYPGLEYKHKPELAEGLDIYAKRVQISNSVKRTVKKQIGGTIKI